MGIDARTPCGRHTHRFLRGSRRDGIVDIPMNGRTGDGIGHHHKNCAQAACLLLSGSRGVAGTRVFFGVLLRTCQKFCVRGGFQFFGLVNRSPYNTAN